MGDTDLILSSGGTAVLCSLLLQHLKHVKWFPFLGMEHAYEQLNRFVSVIVAGVSSIGIHFSFDPTAGQLLITGLTVTGIAHGLWSWATQWAIQHLAYKSMIVPGELAVKNLEQQGRILDELDLAAGRQQHTSRATARTKRLQKDKDKKVKA